MFTDQLRYILCFKRVSSTYGHSQLKTGHPVRSAIHKQLNGRLVLRWVTTWESLLLYVLFSFRLCSLTHMLRRVTMAIVVVLMSALLLL